MIYISYGDALTYTSQFTEETKEILEHLLLVISRAAQSIPDLMLHHVKVRIHLALVLLRMAVEPEKQRE